MTMLSGMRSSALSAVAFIALAGVLGAAASVEVPTITTEPSSQTVNAGQAATFSVVATGVPKPTYQWRKGGAPIIGATNTGYAIASVQLGDVGSYNVEVTNSAGSVTSSVIVLTVNAPLGGTVAGWGAGTTATGVGTERGQSIVPVGLSGVTGIAAGKFHTVAVKGNGTVAAWGAGVTLTGVEPEYGQSIEPAGLSGVTAVAAGHYHTVVLKSDGTVVAWGWNEFGQATVPTGLSGVTAIAAGYYHTVALKSDGTVVVWGYDIFGLKTIPPGLSGVTAIAAGTAEIVALKGDGTVVAWGYNVHNATVVPYGLSGVIAIAAGSDHTVALKSDGTVVAWGNNASGQTSVPVGLGGVTSIAAGAGHTAALKSNGTVVAWGFNDQGQTTIPAGLSGVTALAAGGYHTVALVGTAPAIGPTITTQPMGRTVWRTWNPPQDAVFSVAAAGTPALAYRWQGSIDGGLTWGNLGVFAPYNGVTTETLTVNADATIRSRAQFRCVVTNSTGSVTSSAALLRVASRDESFAGSDNFATTDNWSAPTLLSGTGQLNFATSRLDYVVLYPTSDDATLREWTANLGSYFRDWSVQVDVHLDPIFMAAGEYANLNLIVVKASDTLKPLGLTNRIDIALDRYGTGSGIVQDFGGDFTGNGNRTPATGMVETPSFASDATLRIRFNSTTKELTSWFDADGPTNGFSWTLLQSVNIGTGLYTWNMNESETFAVMLVGGSGNILLSPGMAYFDNFTTAELSSPVITSQPLPRSVSIGGTVTFTVVATGTAPLAYTWKKDDTALVNGSTLSGATTPILTLINLQAADAGNYTCVVSNGLGSPATSNAALLTVNRLTQTLSFGVLPNKPVNAAPFTLSATASSGLPVSYASSNPGVATVNGNTVTLMGIGITTLTASQAGDATYLPAAEVAQTLQVTAAAPLDYSYITSDGTVTITSYTGAGGTVVIPATINGLPVTGIGIRAFQSKPSLTSLTIPESVTSIGDWAFSYCHNLASVVIPDGVTSIGNYAFAYCNNRTRVTLGASVVVIGYAAFCYNTGLVSIAIPDSVHDIGSAAFSFCPDLTAITVGPLNAVYASSAAGVLFNQSQTILLQYPAGKLENHYTIPAGVIAIGEAAFSSCAHLTSVTIPDSVVSIGWSAFNASSRLTSVTIPAGVTSIAGYGFFGCSSLASITIGNGVTSIGTYAFSGCTSLPSVVIPAGVTSLGASAFRQCTSLKGIYCQGNAPGLGTDVFYNDAQATVYYVEGTLGWAATFGGRPTVMLALPSITEQAANQTVTVGQTATFTVVAAGSPAPTLRWQISNDGGLGWSDLAEAAPFSGVTTATLTIGAMMTAQSRSQFHCVASNLVGSVTGNAVILRVAPLATSFTGSDDFSAFGNWSAPTISSGKGRLNFANDRLEYTVSSPTGEDDIALREWTQNNVGSYNKDWAVQIDVHLAAMSLANGQCAWLDLMVVRAVDALKPWEQMNIMDLQIDRYGNGSNTVHDFGGALVGNGSRTPATGMLEVRDNSTDATLRISFNSTTKELTSWTDADGPANGYVWTLLQTVNIGSGIYTWGMNASSTFAIMLVGGATGVSLGSGQAYFDNFLTTGTSVPVITTQPQPQTVSVGANVTFTVVAAGSPAPTYQWRKSDANVPGATSATLTIPNAQLVDAGSYDVVVSNSAGSITSSAATLSVQTGTTAAIQGYGVAKMQRTVQTSAGTPTPISASPFTVEARVFGLNLSGIGAPSFTSPAPSSVPGGALVYDANKVRWGYSSPLSYASLTALNPDFKDGTYVMTVNSVTVNLDLAGATSLPASPRLVGGTWSGGSLQLNASSDWVLTFGAFADHAAESLIEFRINLPGIGVFQRDTFDSSAVSFVIPAGTLAAGGIYAANLEFINLSTLDQSGISGAVGIAGVGTRVNFTIAATTASLAPTITSATGATATVGTAFSYAIIAAPGPIVNFSVTGALPAGVTLNASTGVISGTPTTIGTFAVALTATNANGPSPVVTLTIAVAPAGVAPTVTTQPLKQQVGEGGTVTLTVVAGGTAPLSYEWRKDGGPIVNGGRISGAATATLTIVDALPVDSGTYSVVVSNSVKSATSTGVVVGVVPTGTSFVYAAPGGYNAGGTVTISNAFNYSGTPDGLTLHVLLPEGWSYVWGAGAAGAIEPAPSAASMLDWAWTSLPASPMTFTYVLSVPANTTGVHDLTGFAVLTHGGVGLQLLLQPDPLPVGPAVLHSADTDCSFRINLAELTRVIELYNTRNGTVRTGRYAVAITTTEDGFSPDPATANVATVTLPRYHSADSDHSGKLSLTELTRVIELYSYRVGTVRTGQYRCRNGTEDGFEPGP